MGRTVVGVESTNRIVSECKGAKVSVIGACGKRAPLVWPPRIETLDCFAKLLKYPFIVVLLPAFSNSVCGARPAPRKSVARSSGNVWPDDGPWPATFAGNAPIARSPGPEDLSQTRCGFHSGGRRVQD